MTEKFVPSLEAYHLQDEVTELTELEYLQRRVKDLEKLTELEYLRRKVKDLEKQVLKSSWKSCPDRMGGSFGQDEIDNATTWR